MVAVRTGHVVRSPITETGLVAALAQAGLTDRVPVPGASTRAVPGIVAHVDEGV